MKKILVLVLTLLLATAWAVNVQAAALNTKMIPQNTGWIIHLDVEKFSATQLSALLLSKRLGKFHKTRKSILEKFKLKMLKDIKSVTIFGPGQGKENASVCVSGDFNKQFLLSLLDLDETHKQLKYGKYTLHHWDGDHYGSFATDNLIVFGDREENVKQVLDTLTGKAKNIGASKMMAYLKEIPRNAFLKAVARNISSIAGDHGGPAMLKKTGMAFFMAMEKGSDFSLKLKLNTDTPETAKNIEQILNGFIALGELKLKNTEVEKIKILESIKMTLKKNTLLIELTYPSKEFVELISHGKGFDFRP